MSKKLSISLILGIVCVLITVIGIFSALNRAIFEIPFLSWTLDEDDEEFADELVEIIDDVSDDEIDEFEDETGVDFEVVEDFAEKPSLNKIIHISGLMEEAGFEMDAESISIIKTVRTVIIVYGVIIALLSLLSVIFRKKALAIIALIVSILFYVLVVGWLGLILFAAASIAFVVFLQKNRKQLSKSMNN